MLYEFSPETLQAGIAFFGGRLDAEFGEEQGVPLDFEVAGMVAVRS